MRAYTYHLRWEMCKVLSTGTWYQVLVVQMRKYYIKKNVENTVLHCTWYLGPPKNCFEPLFHYRYGRSISTTKH